MPRRDGGRLLPAALASVVRRDRERLLLLLPLPAAVERRDGDRLLLPLLPAAVERRDGESGLVGVAAPPARRGDAALTPLLRGDAAGPRGDAPPARPALTAPKPRGEPAGLPRAALAALLPLLPPFAPTGAPAAPAGGGFLPPPPRLKMGLSLLPSLAPSQLAAVDAVAQLSALSARDSGRLAATACVRGEPPAPALAVAAVAALPAAALPVLAPPTE